MMHTQPCSSHAPRRTGHVKIQATPQPPTRPLQRTHRGLEAGHAGQRSSGGAHQRQHRDDVPEARLEEAAAAVAERRARLVGRRLAAAAQRRQIERHICRSTRAGKRTADDMQRSCCQPSHFIHVPLLDSHVRKISAPITKYADASDMTPSLHTSGGAVRGGAEGVKIGRQCRTTMR